MRDFKVEVDVKKRHLFCFLNLKAAVIEELE